MRSKFPAKIPLLLLAVPGLLLLITWTFFEGTALHNPLLFLVAGLTLSLLICTGTTVWAARESLAHQGDSQLVQESEERFRALADFANDAIISSNAQGNLVYFNHSAQRIFGWPIQEVLGKPISFLMTQGSWEQYLPLIRNFLATGKATLPNQTLVLTGCRRDGAEFPAETSYFSWRTRSGIFFTAIVRDITARKQVEEMKSDLLSVVSHQLKTPVAEINGYIENLLEGLAGDLTPKQKEYLLEMKAIGIQNDRLISDLLNISKIERGILSVDRNPVALKEILDQALRVYEEPIRAKGLELVLREDHPKALVLADKDRTVEALRNIVHNALKFTDRGVITLRTWSQDGSGFIEVEDTGVGMAPEELSRIFTKEPVMGHEAGRSGAGLGLYIAKNFMELQGGAITVASEKGKGSRFTIRIPGPEGGKSS